MFRIAVFLFMAIFTTSCGGSGVSGSRAVAERFLESRQKQELGEISELFDTDYLVSRQKEILSQFSVMSGSDVGLQTIEAMLGGITLDEAKKMDSGEFFRRSLDLTTSPGVAGEKLTNKSWKLFELDVTENYANYRAEIAIEIEFGDERALLGGESAQRAPEEIVKSLKIGVKKIGREWKIVDLGE